jgi:hypothetical protein
MAQGFMETGNSGDFSPEWYSPVPSRAPHAQTKTLETRRVNSNVKKKTVSKKILESFATSAEQSKKNLKALFFKYNPKQVLRLFGP